MNDYAAYQFSQLITFLGTTDLERTKRFYCDLLGCRFILDQQTCHIYEVCKNSYIGFCLHLGIFTNGPIITMITENVDQLYNELKKQGIEFESPPAINLRYRIYHCFLRDPNGYRIEIQHFLDPFGDA